MSTTSAEQVKWYAAHIVILFEYKDGRQGHYPCFENIVLISARSVSEAYQKAEEIGRWKEEIDDGLIWNDRPATYMFAGVRRLVEVAYAAGDLRDDPEQPPASGSEITYSLLDVKSKKDFDKLCRGETARVWFRDQT